MTKKIIFSLIIFFVPISLFASTEISASPDVILSPAENFQFVSDGLDYYGCWYGYVNLTVPTQIASYPYRGQINFDISTSTASYTVFEWKDNGYNIEIFKSISNSSSEEIIIHDTPYTCTGDRDTDLATAIGTNYFYYEPADLPPTPNFPTNTGIYRATTTCETIGTSTICITESQDAVTYQDWLQVNLWIIFALTLIVLGLFFNEMMKRK